MSKHIIGIAGFRCYRNDIRGYINQFCEFCVKRGDMESNPVDLVPRAKVKKKRARYVPTIDEVVRLIVAATMDWRKKDRWLVYLVAASTGCRVGTLRKLEVHHIKFGRGVAWLELPAEILKAGEESHVWLTRECAERLKTHIENGGGRVVGSHRYVFECVPKPEGFDRDIAKAGLVKKAAPGAPTFSRNSLRHFSTTWLARARRFSDEERASQMSHATPAMTNGVYTDKNHEMLGRSVWLMQPLLPSEFTGNRGKQNGGGCGSKCGKSPPTDLTSGGAGAEDVPATNSVGLTDETAFQRNREPSAAGQLGPRDVAVQGQSEPLAGGSPLCWNALPGPPPRLSQPKRGEQFKSAYPDFGARDPDLIGALQNLADAQTRVIEAQARLIRRLQIGAVDGQPSEPAQPNQGGVTV
jgi:integrase